MIREDYFAVAEALREINGSLAVIEKLNQKLNTAKTIESFYQNEASWLNATIAILEKIEQTTRLNFDTIFVSCIWLLPGSKDGVIDVASEVAHALFKALTAMASHMVESVVMNDVDHAGADALRRLTWRSLRTLAECCRLDAIGYRGSKSETARTLSSSYLFSRKIGSLILPQPDAAVCDTSSAIDVEYLYCQFLQNVSFSGLRRSEIVKVCLEIQKMTRSVILKPVPIVGESCAAIDVASGLMSFHLPGYAARTDALYFKYDHLDTLFDELGSVLDVAHRKHCRRWLVNLIRKFSYQQLETPRESVRAASNELCEVVMNYIPIIARLRSSPHQNNGHRGNLGTIIDLTKKGCKISFRSMYYERPCVGRLIFVASQSIGQKVGIVRWIGNSDGTRRGRVAKVGVEFLGDAPRTIPVKASCQWPSGLYVENLIHINDVDQKHGEHFPSNSILMVQPIKSHSLPRSIEAGKGEQIYGTARLLEQGMDFELAWYCAVDR